MAVKINVVLENGAKAPTYQTSGACGADLYAFIEKDITIKPSERVLIGTGVVMEIPENHGGFIFPRSGLAVNHGITLVNAVGVIDSDYRGEIKVPVINLSHNEFVISRYDRIAQIVILPIEKAAFTISHTVSETERSVAGFGSTGVQ